MKEKQTHSVHFKRKINGAGPCRKKDTTGACIGWLSSLGKWAGQSTNQTVQQLQGSAPPRPCPPAPPHTLGHSRSTKAARAFGAAYQVCRCIGRWHAPAGNGALTLGQPRPTTNGQFRMGGTGALPSAFGCVVAMTKTMLNQIVPCHAPAHAPRRA